jgi:hypothetical protein
MQSKYYAPCLVGACANHWLLIDRDMVPRWWLDEWRPRMFLILTCESVDIKGKLY